VHTVSSWSSPGQSFDNRSRSGYLHQCRFIGMHIGTENNAPCFVALRQQRAAVRRCLPLAAYKSLIVSPVLSRPDYSNTTLSSLPDYQFRRPVINAAARSIFDLRWSDHVTSALMELHGLSAVDQVDFKVVTFVFRCLYDFAHGL